MKWQSHLAQARLYAILDLDYVAPAEAVAMAEQLLTGGADLLQLRAKHDCPADLFPLAQELQLLCRRHAVPLIINDYAELALELKADGCHVGQDDLTVAEVRALLPSHALVGLSTHSLEQARAAVLQAPDYIGYGPLFATPTKPDYQPIGLTTIAQVHQEVPLPIFCIGGIKPWNLTEVLQAGARRVVMVSALLQAENPKELTRQLRACIQSNAAPF